MELTLKLTALRKKQQPNFKFLDFLGNHNWKAHLTLQTSFEHIFETILQQQQKENYEIPVFHPILMVHQSLQPVLHLSGYVQLFLEKNRIYCV